MLTDEVLDKVIDRLIVRINKGNEYVLRKMGESVKKIGTLTPTQAQELGQILKYGGDYEKIAQELAKLTDMNVADIYKIFEEVARNDWQFAKQFYKYRNIKYIPFDENGALKKQVKAIAKITANEYLNLARTSVLGYAVKNKNGQLTIRSIKQVYHELIDEAILNVSQGKETFDSVMYRKLKEIGESGLKVVYPTTYVGKDGKEHHYTRRLDSAIRMNVKDGLRMLHNETQQQFGKEFKSDGVEISVHLNPAPDHQFVQGHQFSNEEFEKFQSDQDSTSYDGTFYPAESDETGHDRRSIGEYNCYHYVFSIVLGISEPEYTKKQLQEIIDSNNKGFDFEGKHYTNYEGLQLQRKIETEIRKAKDNQILGRASNNEPLIAESQLRITQLTNKYRELNQASGLPSSINRAKVSGYKKASTKEFDKKVKAMYNIGTREENLELYLKAQKKQQKIRNGETNLNIIKEKQRVHNLEDDKYVEGKSYFNIILKEEQKLVNKYAGNGFIPNTKKGELTNKEICTTDKIIGKYINKNLKKEVDTNSFVIHYSKDGVHIVPADFREVKKNE